MPSQFSARGGGRRPSGARRMEHRVGYTWNRGGRLKELRIRHLARKFCYLWIWKTFGRVHPSRARFHHRTAVLQKALEGWKEEWWVSRREWPLSVRADCHYRYYLYNRAFCGWRQCVSMKTEKKRNWRRAESYAQEQRLAKAWEAWQLYLEMRRKKLRMQEIAMQQRKHAALRSAWSRWRGHLRLGQDQGLMEEVALEHWALALQCRVWLWWREAYLQVVSQRNREARARQHYGDVLKRSALQAWTGYVGRCRLRRKQQFEASRLRRLNVLSRYWHLWQGAVLHRQCERDHWQLVTTLAQQSTQHRALALWRAYVEQHADQEEKERCAIEHDRQRLLRVGLQLLAQNVRESKARRVDKNLALQQHWHSVSTARLHQDAFRLVVTLRFWTLWRRHYEEAEERKVQPQSTVARQHYSTALLKSSVWRWRGCVTAHRLEQDMELRADAWFTRRVLPRCLGAWAEFAARQRLSREQKKMAEVHRRQQTYSWVFYTWWERWVEQSEHRLAERTDITYTDRSVLRRAWDRWRLRAAMDRLQREKQASAGQLYRHTLACRTLNEWKGSVTWIRAERERMNRALRYDQMRCVRRALNCWKKYVQYRRSKARQVERLSSHYSSRLLTGALEGWKVYHQQRKAVYHSVEELENGQQQALLREALSVWRENTAQLAEERIKYKKAGQHHQHCLLSKFFQAWRRTAVHVLRRRQQQDETIEGVRTHLQRVFLQQVFQHWRERSRMVVEERISREMAECHHHTALQRRALQAWKQYHHKQQRVWIMQRQATCLLAHRTCLRYFICWKRQLLIRQKEAELTEVALWHWSLNLQGKVLAVWRDWVKEQHRKQHRLAQAVEFYRDGLLREGSARILTYATDMASFRTSLSLRSQQQSSHRLQQLVWRCAMRWKWRALRRAGGVPRVLPKKGVSFCHSPPQARGVGSQSCGAEEGREDESISSLILSARALRLQPRRSEHLLLSPDAGLERSAAWSSTQRLTLLAKPSSVTQRKEVGPSSAITHQAPVLKGPDCTNLLGFPKEPISQELLLPPSSFMTCRKRPLETPQELPRSEVKDSCCPDVLLSPDKFSTSPKSLLTADGGRSDDDDDDDDDGQLNDKRPTLDPITALTKELLSIQQDMQCFQDNRKQLQAWHRLADVLRSWLQTSAVDDEDSRNTRQELGELEARIERLALQLEVDKVAMQKHASRIRHIGSLVQEAHPSATGSAAHITLPQ